MEPQTADIFFPSLNNLQNTNYYQYPSFVQNERNRDEIIIKGSKAYAFFKRGFDILLSFLLILLLSPLLLVLAFLVKTTSKGCVLFRDKRIGYQEKEIGVLKFRTMYSDAETHIHKYLTDEQYRQWKIERKLDNDPRITKIGKFLRKTSMDELPQIFNIFMGTLSFVGPRPVTALELKENYTHYERRCLAQVKPGLTGYWQVYGRSDVDYKSGERQKEELAYLPRRSLLFDLKLMILTIPAVLKHKGAK